MKREALDELGRFVRWGDWSSPRFMGVLVWMSLAAGAGAAQFLRPFWGAPGMLAGWSLGALLVIGVRRTRARALGRSLAKGGVR